MLACLKASVSQQKIPQNNNLLEVFQVVLKALLFSDVSMLIVNTMHFVFTNVVKILQSDYR